ncbi:MAG: DoxX family protein [Pararhodobacter sp.]
MTNVTLLAARILLSAIFIISGLGKMGDVAGFAGYMASGGVPGFLAWPVILLEVLGGIAILVGFQIRYAALALAAFSLLSGLLYHFDPADQMQMTAFLKNLGLTGGYLLLTVTGAGAWAVDAMMGRNTRTA